MALSKVSVGELPPNVAYRCFKRQDDPLQEARRTVNAATQAEAGLGMVCQALSQTIHNISAIAESSAVVDLDDFHFEESEDGQLQLSERESTPSGAAQHVAAALESLHDFTQVQKSRQS